jgi:hypothetical protein
MEIKHIKYTIVSVCIVLAIMVFLYFSYSMFLGAQKISQDVADLRRSLISDRIQNEELASFKVIHDKYRTNLESIHNSLVLADNPIDFITFIETIASNNNIKAEVSIINQAQEKKLIGASMVFSVIIEQDFSSVIKFIKDLEVGPYASRVKSISMKKVIANNNLPKVSNGIVEAYITIEALTR